ncbi:MAG: hypothetical protein CVV30_07515 [Methanomicrobiales archaeon HGW-Methanomicrobiales-1]|nr:MAG: hypothetical protein CVV30_07515 [Methanomicrobiales archaeon HGW-Methanomicrobiales-1]
MVIPVQRYRAIRYEYSLTGIDLIAICGSYPDKGIKEQQPVGADAPLVFRMDRVVQIRSI